MVKTLKELKKLYPSKIVTSGNIYVIDGFGKYRQRVTKFGIETYVEKMSLVGCETFWARTRNYIFRARLRVIDGK